MGKWALFILEIGLKKVRATYQAGHGPGYFLRLGLERELRF